jgi:hypothetical protein
LKNHTDEKTVRYRQKAVKPATVKRFARHFGVDRSPSVPSSGKRPLTRKSARSWSFCLNLSTNPLCYLLFQCGDVVELNSSDVGVDLGGIDAVHVAHKIWQSVLVCYCDAWTACQGAQESNTIVTEP